MKKKMNVKAKRIVSFLLALVLVFGVCSTSASAATTKTARCNVSTKKVTCNASVGNLPTSAGTIYTGKSYYYNFQVSSDRKVKKAELYVRLPGNRTYSNVYTATAKNYMRWSYYKYAVPSYSGGGTLKYYWKLTYTNGKTSTSPTYSVKVKIK